MSSADFADRLLGRLLLGHSERGGRERDAHLVNRRRCRADRVPHHGVVKNNACLHTRVAAPNLRRLLTLGLRLAHCGWALAAA